MTDNELIRKEILYANGKLKTEWFETSNGQVHGVLKHYYKNGQLEYETPYEHGQAHGVSKGYYYSGELSYETPYEHGQAHGLLKDYDKSGKCIDKVFFFNGEEVTPKIFAEHQAQQAAMLEKSATQQHPQSKPKPK